MIDAKGSVGIAFSQDIHNRSAKRCSASANGLLAISPLPDELICFAGICSATHQTQSLATPGLAPQRQYPHFTHVELPGVESGHAL